MAFKSSWSASVRMRGTWCWLQLHTPGWVLTRPSMCVCLPPAPLCLSASSLAPRTATSLCSARRNSSPHPTTLLRPSRSCQRRKSASDAWRRYQAHSCRNDEPHRPGSRTKERRTRLAQRLSFDRSCSACRLHPTMIHCWLWKRRLRRRMLLTVAVAMGLRPQVKLQLTNRLPRNGCCKRQL